MIGVCLAQRIRHDDFDPAAQTPYPSGLGVVAPARYAGELLATVT